MDWDEIKKSPNQTDCQKLLLASNDLVYPLETSLVEVSQALTVVFVSYYVVSISLMWQRRQLFPVHARSFTFMFVQFLGSLSCFAMSTVRDAMGRRNYPCLLFLINLSLFLPLLMAPWLIQVVQMYLCAQLTDTLKNLDLDENATASSLQDLQKKIARSGRAMQHKGLFLVLVPPISVVIVKVILGPQYLLGCTSCGADKTSQLFLFFFGVCFVCPSLILLRKLRNHDDPMGLRKELSRELYLALICGFAWMGFGFFDFLSLGENGIASWTWILQGIYIHAHQVYCVRPVMATFRNPTAAVKFRRRAKTVSKANKNVILPESSYFSSYDPSAEISAATAQQRVRLEHILMSKKGLQAFERHLAAEYNVESILFYRLATNWRESFEAGIFTQSSDDMARQIYENFIPDSAKMQINISAVQQEYLNDLFQISDDQFSKEIPRTAFDESIIEVFNLMKRDSFHRFKATKAFENVANEILEDEEIMRKAMPPN